ncbi:hypothetical protein ACTJJE_07320 [Mycolicibacterium sp. 22603]
MPDQTVGGCPILFAELASALDDRGAVGGQREGGRGMEGFAQEKRI